MPKSRKAKVAEVPRVEISDASTIAEILDARPETFEVFEKYFAGACFFCPASSQETLRDGAAVHGYDEAVLITELYQTIADHQKKTKKSKK